MRQGARPSAPADDGRRPASGSDPAGSDLFGCLCDVLLAVCEASSGPEPRTVVVAPPREGGPGPEGLSGGPYEVPPAAPSDPVRGVVLFGFERVATASLMFGVRGEAFVDVPAGRRGGALRLGLEHAVYRERVRGRGEQTPEASHWDDLPLTALRVGWMFRMPRWEVGPVAALRLLWFEHDAEPGMDVGLHARYEGPPWFFEASATGMVVGAGRLVGAEPFVRAGFTQGLVQVGLGWRHLQFWRAEVLPYTGPELTVALRL